MSTIEDFIKVGLRHRVRGVRECIIIISGGPYKDVNMCECLYASVIGHWSSAARQDRQDLTKVTRLQKHGGPKKMQLGQQQ